MRWPRADVLSLIAIILGGVIALATPEIRCLLHLPSERCQNLEEAEQPTKNVYNPEATSPKSQLSTNVNVRVGGATSMARMSRYLHERVSSYSTNMSINYSHNGSEDGMRKLSNDEIDVSGLSRELSDSEKQKGFIAIPIAEDPIAVVVGKDNPIKDLSDKQVEQIFRCEVTNWFLVGRKPGPIKAINRGYTSGTRKVFQKQALKGKEFCGDIKTWPVDETTRIVRQLGSNGITFATYSDVVKQLTTKIVKIDSLMPNASNYPYRHSLYYVYKSDNPVGAKFLKYINSLEGREAIEEWKRIGYVNN